MSAILDCQFFLTDKKVNSVLVCSSIFFYSKKWIKETVLSEFHVENEIKCAKIFKMLAMAFG